jgi:hypothetical protein
MGVLEVSFCVFVACSRREGVSRIHFVMPSLLAIQGKIYDLGSILKEKNRELFLN